MRVTFRWPAPLDDDGAQTAFTATTARSLVGTTTSIAIGNSTPVLAVIVFAHVVNDEIGNALVVTLDFDAAKSGANGAGVLGTSGRRPGRTS